MTPIRSAGIAPARVSFDAQGTPRASAYDDVYHSADGGVGQARHVFLSGNGLPERWRGRNAFTIVETGFGLGLNFLATWAALRDDPAGPSRLNYVSVEKHPLGRVDLESVHRRWPQFADLARELHRAWPPLTHGFHRLDFDRGTIALTLLLGDAADMLAALDARVDAIYLDGFAPERNPEMWSDAVLRELGRLSAPGTTVATWTVAGAIRERLERAGFRVEKRPGYGRKREMLTAECVRTGTVRPDSRPASNRHAAIVGAGLAGAWCAHTLATRGWQIDLIERHQRPAQEASGNAVAALRPALNLADNENARLARAAFLYTAHKFRMHPELQHVSAQTGVLHLAMTTAQAERMARILDAHAFPHAYAQWVDANAAARLAGRAVAGPGWWIPLGGWCQPIGLCETLIDLAQDRVVRRYGRGALGMTRGTDGWHVNDADGKTIAAAPVVILANAFDATRMLGGQALSLVQVRGQVSYVPPAPGRGLDIVVCGDGYVAPMPGGGHCVGATFQPEDSDARMRIEDHVQNLDRLHRMLPRFAAGLTAAHLEGRAALRTATPDRLPACGPLSNAVGDTTDDSVHVVTGLGARGLIWAPLCAEVLASRLDGEPNPIERSLIDAMRPTRLAVKQS